MEDHDRDRLKKIELGDQLVKTTLHLTQFLIETTITNSRIIHSKIKGTEERIVSSAS